ncbi:MAG: hypothetical protein L0221_16865, partial [Chloroflexi bacterium]|nr:hypothetical protein [Chloroflexota bacterium]
GAGALVGFGASLLGAGDDAEDTETKIKKLAASIEELAALKAAEEFLASLGAAGVESNLSDIATQLERLAEVSPGAAQAVVQGMNEMGGQTDVTAEAFSRAAQGQGVLGEALARGTQTYAENASAAKDVANANAEAAASMDPLASAATTAEQTLSDAAEAAGQYKTILDGLLGIHLNSIDAQLAYRESMIGIGEAAKEAKDKTDLFSDANIGLASDISGATQGVQDFAEALIVQNGPQALPFATQLLRDHRQGLIDTLTQYGFAPAAIETFLAAMNLTPEAIDAALGSLTGLSNELGTGLPDAAAVGAGGYTASMTQISNATALALLGAEQAFITTKPRLVTQATDLGQQAFVATGAGFAAIPPEVARTLAQAGVEVLLAAPPVAAAGNTVGAGMTEGFSQGGSPMPQEAGRLTAEAAAAGT